MVPGSSLDTDVIMALGGITGHPDRHGYNETVTLKHHHVLRWQSYPQASAQSLIVTVARDINADPGYGRVTDPDMACLRILIAEKRCHGHSNSDKENI